PVLAQDVGEVVLLLGEPVLGVDVVERAVGDARVLGVADLLPGAQHLRALAVLGLAAVGVPARGDLALAGVGHLLVGAARADDGLAGLAGGAAPEFVDARHAAVGGAEQRRLVAVGVGEGAGRGVEDAVLVVVDEAEAADVGEAAHGHAEDVR